MVSIYPKVNGSVSDADIERETTAAHTADPSVPVRTRAEESDEKVKDGILIPMVDMLPEDRELATGKYVGVDIGSGDNIGVTIEL